MTRRCLMVMALFATGCLDTNFDPPNVVKDPRILTITTNPPEAALGEDFVFEALVVDADGSDLSTAPGVEFRFMVCVSLAAIVSASGIASGVSLDDNCSEGGDDLIRLETGGGLPPNSARLPGAPLLELALELMGGGTPMPDPDEQTIDPRVLQTLGLVIAEVGIPLRVRLEVWRDGEQILTGFKRFAIAQRADVTTNPPPPRFAINGVWLSAREGDPHTCVPEEGQIPEVVAATEEIPFTPDENEDPWIEEYPVIALDGTLQINEESAYYSWFSTGGLFDADITQRPMRDVMWTAPEEPGDYPIWLVVRDGHLGTSYCRADVRVVAAE